MLSYLGCYNEKFEIYFINNKGDIKITITDINNNSVSCILYKHINTLYHNFTLYDKYGTTIQLCKHNNYNVIIKGSNINKKIVISFKLYCIINTYLTRFYTS